MSHCINPTCYKNNTSSTDKCEFCGSDLILNCKIRVISPIRIREKNIDIYHCLDIETSEVRILKVLTRYSERELQLFYREYQSLDAIFDVDTMTTHPRIPSLYSYSVFRFTPTNSTFSLHCLVLEKKEGKELAEWIKEGNRLTTDEAIDWLKQLVAIIKYIHDRKVIHRDIKPDNIILQPDGGLALIDFGSSRKVLTSTYLLKVSLTQTAKVPEANVTAWVSPGYTAPEQYNGGATQRSDFYAIGRTFVHLLTGTRPIDLIPDWININWRQKAKQYPKPLLDFIDKLMAADAHQRPNDATEILNFLDSKLPAQLKIFQIRHSIVFRILSLFLFGALCVAGYKIYIYSRFQNALQTGNHNLFELKHYDDAIKFYEEALKIYPNEPTVLNNLANACSLKNKDTCAIDSYEKLVSLDPSCLSYYNFASYYDRQFDESINNPSFKDAINLADKYYRKSLNLCLSDALKSSSAGKDVKNELSNVFNQINDSKDINNSSKLLDKALKYLSTESYLSLGNYARILILKGQLTLAKPILIKGLSLSESLPNQNADYIKANQAAILKNLGWWYYEKKNYKIAESYLFKSLKKNSQRTDTYCLIAQALAKDVAIASKPLGVYRKACAFGFTPDSASIEVQQWKLELFDKISRPLSEDSI